MVELYAYLCSLKHTSNTVASSYTEMISNMDSSLASMNNYMDNGHDKNFDSKPAPATAASVNTTAPAVIMSLTVMTSLTKVVMVTRMVYLLL